jgi:hypothetical protein
MHIKTTSPEDTDTRIRELKEKLAIFTNITLSVLSN